MTKLPRTDCQGRGTRTRSLDRPLWPAQTTSMRALIPGDLGLGKRGVERATPDQPLQTVPVQRPALSLLQADMEQSTEADPRVAATGRDAPRPDCSTSAESALWRGETPEAPLRSLILRDSRTWTAAIRSRLRRPSAIICDQALPARKDSPSRPRQTSITQRDGPVDPERTTTLRAAPCEDGRGRVYLFLVWLPTSHTGRGRQGSSGAGAPVV